MLLEGLFLFRESYFLNIKIRCRGAYWTDLINLVPVLRELLCQLRYSYRLDRAPKLKLDSKQTVTIKIRHFQERCFILCCPMLYVMLCVCVVAVKQTNLLRSNVTRDKSSVCTLPTYSNKQTTEHIKRKIGSVSSNYDLLTNIFAKGITDPRIH